MSMRFRSGLNGGKREEASESFAFGKAALRHYGTLAAAFFMTALVAGCGEMPGGDLSERAYKPLSPQLLALMQEKGIAPSSPMLIRAFKKEAEVEVWKMKADGHYALLKTYPICRWSGQLGPKTREGDRQVPEGFYTIGPAQMNPHSAYYLSFNVGYPNAYDRAHGYTGGEIMVHGVCSSAGCFSMTDQQIAEIYAIARESFAGGQKEIQFQSFPFHMTAENFARYRLDPNVAFWKELKVGYDTFAVTKQEVAVGVCNSHYVFNAVPANGAAFDPTGPCPPLKRDATVALAVSAKEAADNAKVAALVASGVRPVHTVYADGGQNAQFSQRWDIEHWKDVSRPDALAQGPVDVPLDKSHKYKTPTLAQLEAEKKKADLAAAVAERKAEAAHATAYADPAPTTPAQPAQPHFALPQWLPGQGQAAEAQNRLPAPQAAETGPSPSAQAAQADPYAAARTAQAAAPVQPAQAAPQSGFNLANFGHFFGGQQPAQPVAGPQQPAPVQAAAAPLPPPHNETYRALAPQIAAKESSAKESSARSAEAKAAKTEKSKTAEAGTETKSQQAKADRAKDQDKTKLDGSTPPSAAQAAADAAKAAYAAPEPGAEPVQETSPSGLSLLSQGFSSFTGKDH